LVKLRQPSADGVHGLSKFPRGLTDFQVFECLKACRLSGLTTGALAVVTIQRRNIVTRFSHDALVLEVSRPPDSLPAQDRVRQIAAREIRSAPLHRGGAGV